METTAERVTQITVRITDTSLGDEVETDPRRDQMYEAYCDEYAAGLQAEYPDASVLIGVAPHGQLQEVVDIRVEPYDGSHEAYTRWEQVRARVQEIGEQVFDRGNWVR
jgi:hypothetical protein